ncbi:hypothetical protein J7E73_22350 [Paenibacillus albidus]|uniref:hypothetical protein n=1 Tax=Paenibacillus albidus TaxID=2041023 RepID=UPI001BE856A1|nr:hypothetical protein [Paenibacillus albidus]MBT2291818.1 hypothetical protein [Paenibacillus albidus]
MSELEDLIKHVNDPRVAILCVRRADVLSKFRDIKLKDDCYSVSEVAERFKGGRKTSSFNTRILIFSYVKSNIIVILLCFSRGVQICARAQF